MKILMVCLGNICRSPMAEGILRHMSSMANKKYYVDSAGTSDYHIGEAPDERAIKKLKKYKIDISNLKARQFSAKDFDGFDLILTMDESNYINVLKLARNKNDTQKVKMIMQYVYPNQHIPVPDPYYGSDNDFEKVYEMLSIACKKIIEHHP